MVAKTIVFARKKIDENDWCFTLDSGLVVEHRKQLKINEKKSTSDAIIVRINDMKICPRVQMSFLRFKRSRQRIRIWDFVKILPHVDHIIHYKLGLPKLFYFNFE